MLCRNPGFEKYQNFNKRKSTSKQLLLGHNYDNLFLTANSLSRSISLFLLISYIFSWKLKKYIFARGHLYLISAAMMSWVGCLITEAELFILFAEDSQILLKISVIPILLTFMYLVALNLSVNNQFNSSSNSTHHCGRN